jgi:hypothetical protein
MQMHLRCSSYPQVKVALLLLLMMTLTDWMTLVKRQVTGAEKKMVGQVLKSSIYQKK